MVESLAALAATADQKAFGDELGKFINAQMEKYPKISPLQTCAIIAQLLGHCVGGAFKGNNLKPALEVVMKNLVHGASTSAQTTS